MIDFRHEYLISTVASALGLTNDEVTESLLEGSQVCTRSIKLWCTSHVKFDLSCCYYGKPVEQAWETKNYLGLQEFEIQSLPVALV